MQRVLPFVLAAMPLAAAAGAQDASGAALWRVAATTLPLPPALATGPGAVLWNPAQRDDSARTQAALEAVQTPSAIGASGVLAALRVRAGAVGEVGLVYGRVGLTDLARTTDTPDPVGSAIPVYTYAIGVTWAPRVALGSGATTVGATLAFHETRLDTDQADRWTIDVGVNHTLGDDLLRVAAATHFVSSLSAASPAQDVYAGVEYRVWRGVLWGDRAALRGRYGVAFGHGHDADHHVGLGAEFGNGGTLALDAGVVREGGYGVAAWRAVGGIRLRVGKYRVTLARDAGVNDLGSAYRVGVEARVR
jgi:hypothetical protein